MKSRETSTVKNLNETEDLNSSCLAILKTELTLIECLLDVPEHRLENYIINDRKSFVSDITTKVLKAKKQTNDLITELLSKTKQ